MQTDDCGVYVKLVARSAGVPSFYLSWNLDLIYVDEEVVPPEKKEGLCIEYGSSPTKPGRFLAAKQGKKLLFEKEISS